MRFRKHILCFFIFLITSTAVFSQEITAVFSQEITADKSSRVKKTDSVKVITHNPTAAMLYSIIPGGGQIYNRKYWKLPIVYGTIGASSYFVYRYAKQMTRYKNEFIYRRDGLWELTDPTLSNSSNENILSMKQTAQRNIEIAIAATALLYALNIIDAMVDAHLFYFDVSDDLSLHWSPALLPNYATTYKPTYGIGLSLKF